MNELLKRIEELEERISILEAGEKLRAVYTSFPDIRLQPAYVEIEDPPWPDDEPFITGFDWDGTNNADKQ